MVPMVASGTANLKLILGSLWPSMLMPSDKVHLVYPLLPKYAYILQETGYAHLQATKPDTIGECPHLISHPRPFFVPISHPLSKISHPLCLGNWSLHWY